MTTQEFSAEFDTLLNSYSNIERFGLTEHPLKLDEYEKSVLLTTAQEEVVRGLYNGTFNGESLEATEKLRRALDTLIVTDTPNEIPDMKGLDSNSKFYQLKDNVWYITYESAELEEGVYCKDNTTIQVIPMKQDEWHRVKNNPFKRPNGRKAVRLDAGDKVVEIISEYPITKYLVRYLRKPNPIILTPLEGDLLIDKEQNITQCELNTVLHRPILEVAVQLAMRRLPSASK